MFSKCDPETSSNTLSANSPKNETHLKCTFSCSTQTEILGVGPRNVCFSKPTWWLWFMLTMENLCLSCGAWVLMFFKTPKWYWCTRVRESELSSGEWVTSQHLCPGRRVQGLASLRLTGMFSEEGEASGLAPWHAQVQREQNGLRDL